MKKSTIKQAVHVNINSAQVIRHFNTHLHFLLAQSAVTIRQQQRSALYVPGREKTNTSPNITFRKSAGINTDQKNNSFFLSTKNRRKTQIVLFCTTPLWTRISTFTRKLKIRNERDACTICCNRASQSRECSIRLKLVFLCDMKKMGDNNGSR